MTEPSISNRFRQTEEGDLISVMCRFKIRYRLVVTLCMLTPLFCGAEEPAVSNEVSYLSFEVPGALGTYPMSINNSMVVTGYYYVSSTDTRGFVRDADGALTTFDVLGGVWTEPESINAAGDIAGFYEVVAGVPHGFLRYADGRVITSDPPVSGLTPPQALPVSINDSDEGAGNYPGEDGHSSGFTRLGTGVFVTFGFGQGADNQTVVTGLNESGSVVGYFFLGGGSKASFLRHPDGFSTLFVVPVERGQRDQNFNSATIAEGINAEGGIVGWYVNCLDYCVRTSTGGFVLSPQGVFTLFSPPGTLLTSPLPGFAPDRGSLSVAHRLSINGEESIAGSYTDAEGAQHGFVRNQYGTITSFDPPRGSKTTATSINDSGVIAGSYYYDWNAEIAQGFLRLPKP